METDHFVFEFPTPTTYPILPNDIVFCGKLIGGPQRPTNPLPLRSESFGKLNTTRSGGLIQPSTGENRCRKSSSFRKHHNGLFGMLKFPLEMELSDIKMRQGRRDPAPLPKLPESGDGDSLSGGKSCWELVRPLRRRGLLMSVLAKATFGCIPRL